MLFVWCPESFCSNVSAQRCSTGLRGQKGNAGSKEAQRGKWHKIEEVKISTGVNLWLMEGKEVDLSGLKTPLILLWSLAWSRARVVECHSHVHVFETRGLKLNLFVARAYTKEERRKTCARTLSTSLTSLHLQTPEGLHCPCFVISTCPVIPSPGRSNLF